MVPFFRRQIRNGCDHLPITDAGMTRFWITLQQGVDFVLKNFERMHGGRDLRAEDSVGEEWSTWPGRWRPTFRTGSSASVRVKSCMRSCALRMTRISRWNSRITM